MLLRKSVKVGFALKGGNQQLLAMHIDRSEATLSKYMNGKTVPSFNTVLSICEYFKVPMSDFCKWGE